MAMASLGIFRFGDVEVYPLYWAREIGVHRFLHPGQENAASIGEVHSSLAKLKMA